MEFKKINHQQKNILIINQIMNSIIHLALPNQ